MNLPYYTYSAFTVDSVSEQWVSYSQSPATSASHIDYAGGSGYGVNFTDDTTFEYNHGCNTYGPESVATRYEGYPLSYQHPPMAYSPPAFDEPRWAGNPCLEPAAPHGWYSSESSPHETMQNSNYVSRNSTTRNRNFQRTSSKPERQITVIELSDDDEEPVKKAARLEIPSVDETEIRRRENEIIEFWESRFVRSGARQSELFPEIFLLKDAFDLDKYPLAGLKRFFMNVHEKQASLCFETSSTTSEQGCPGSFMARCRWAPNQSWFTGYGTTVENAKNEAAKLALISILGPEEFDLIVDMSNSRRYEGLDRKRINAALRRKALMMKYKCSPVHSLSSSVSDNSPQDSPLTSRISSTGKRKVVAVKGTKKAGIDPQPSDTFASSRLLVSSNSSTDFKQQDEAISVQCESGDLGDRDTRRGESSANKVHLEGSSDHLLSLGLKTHTQRQLCSGTEGLQGKLSSDFNHSANISCEREDKLPDSHKICKSDGADTSHSSGSDEVLKSVSSAVISDGDVRRHSPNHSKEEIKQFDISQWSNPNNRAAEDASSLGGSGSDLSDEETECYGSRRLSSKLRNRRLENKIIKFWFDRMPIFRGKKQLLNVFELHKLRNLNKNAKKAVSILFARSSQRPEFKVSSINSESFSVQCLWQEVCVLGTGKTIPEAENEAGNEIIKEVLGETEYRRLCQMTDESLYLDLDVGRICRHLDINRTTYHQLDPLKNSTSSGTLHESNFDFQLVNHPKRLKLYTHPLTKASLQTESNMLTTKLRIHSVNQCMKQKFRSIENIASLQEFSRLENISDLEKNAVSALGSLFAKLDEPCPVYTCVPYMDPASFKVECVVRGKYFVAEDSTEEAAKNAAAVMALKFLMGTEKFQEQNEKSRRRTLEEEAV